MLSTWFPDDLFKKYDYKTLSVNLVNIQKDFLEKNPQQSKEFFKEFYRLYKKHFDGKILSYEDFVINANLKQKESAGYLFSKYINMKFIDIFLSANASTRNKIATDFLRYAASNTDQSSFFVKIS